jgi:hypothetical protein
VESTALIVPPEMDTVMSTAGVGSGVNGRGYPPGDGGGDRGSAVDDRCYPGLYRPWSAVVVK